MRRLGRNVKRWWRGSVARRLGADRAGNVLMLTAAMLVPMLLLLGSGIDVGRVYVARSRLQQACDAASLAGRWSVASGATTDKVQQEVMKYFKFNYDYTTDTMGTKPFTPAVSVKTSGSRTVTVTASTTLPMSVMGMFKMADMPVTANCSAQQDFVNIDVVLVLDVTGSMGDKATGTDTQTKIQALRTAVLALYDQLAKVEPQLTAAGMRLRYAIVPYSSSVNLKEALYHQVGPQTMQTDSRYQTCVKPADAQQRHDYSTCSLGSPVNHQSGWFNGTWNGCIEERSTINSITQRSTWISPLAYDLDVDAPPDTNDKKWVPQDTAQEQAANHADCPVGAVRLKSWTRTDLNTYLNSLVATGTTYHDIGLTWGARMISSGGVFADSPTSYNGMPVTKYMIFMTDGALNADETIYSAWGVEAADKRTTPDGTYDEAKDTHTERTILMCNAIKNGGTSLWVIGLGTSLEAYMKQCASSPGQVSTAGSSDALVSTFKAIGQSIGALRLSQ